MLRALDKILTIGLAFGILAFCGMKVRDFRNGRDAKPGPTTEIVDGAKLPAQKLSYLTGDWRDEIRLFRRTVGWNDLSAKGCLVAIFFESSCEWCHETAAYWTDKPGMRIGRATVPVQWVTVNPGDKSATTMVDSLRLRGRVLAMPSLAEANRIGVSHWPMAYLVGREGTLLRKVPADVDSLFPVPAACMQSEPDT